MKLLTLLLLTRETRMGACQVKRHILMTMESRWENLMGRTRIIKSSHSREVLERGSMGWGGRWSLKVPQA